MPRFILSSYIIFLFTLFFLSFFLSYFLSFFFTLWPRSCKLAWNILLNLRPRIPTMCQFLVIPFKWPLRLTFVSRTFCVLKKFGTINFLIMKYNRYAQAKFNRIWEIMSVFRCVYLLKCNISEDIEWWNSNPKKGSNHWERKKYDKWLSNYNCNRVIGSITV